MAIETQSRLGLRHILIAALLVLLTVSVFAPVRNYGFISVDDPQYVSENPQVAQGLTRESVGWAFTGVHASYWIPLNWLSHMVDVQLFGLDAGKHHVTNLLLHLINVLLLCVLLYRMTRATGRSALVAALFAVHPLHVESVVWITERKDVLSTLFLLLALLAYLGYVRKPMWPRMGLVAVFFCLGLMVKPIVVTLPMVLLLLDLWPLERIAVPSPVTSGVRSRRRVGEWFQAWRPLLQEKLPLFAISMTGALLTLVTQADAIPALERIPAPTRLANAIVSYGTYLWKTVWPTGLIPFYPYPESIPGWKVLLSAALLAGVTALALRSWRGRPYLTVGWLWYLGVLFPVSGMVQAGHQAMADRFTYVPLIGIFIMVAWGAHDLLRTLSRRDAVLRVAGAAAVVSCAVAARHQVGHWSSELVLWQHALDVAPDSYVAHTSLGIALQESGEATAAMPHYREALRLRPDFSEARNNLAVALANEGDLEQAIEQFRAAVRYDPDQPAFHYNLAVLLARRGETDEAVQHLREVLRLDPQYADAQRELERLTRQQAPEG